ncbi:MAG: hypothetical protein AB1749_10095 [Pseudomonadota bacterium]
MWEKRPHQRRGSSSFGYEAAGRAGGAITSDLGIEAIVLGEVGVPASLCQPACEGHVRRPGGSGVVTWRRMKRDFGHDKSKSASESTACLHVLELAGARDRLRLTAERVEVAAADVVELLVDFARGGCNQG